MKISTNVKTLTAVSKIMKSIGLNGLPQIDFNGNETAKEIAATIVLQIASDYSIMIKFLEEIIKDDIEVKDMGVADAHRAAELFFESLPKVYLTTIVKQLNEFGKQKKTAGNLTPETLMEMMKFLDTNPEALTDFISSESQKQD